MKLSAQRLYPDFSSKIRDWESRPARYFLREKSVPVGTAWEKTQLLSLTKQGVIDRDIDSGIGKYPASFEGYQLVEPGNLVFCLFDVEETPRTVGLVKNRGMITSAYTAYEVNQNVADPRFLEYFFVSVDNAKLYKPFYTGLRNTIPKGALLGTKLSLPPIDKQKAIADFLDRELRKIDRLVAEQNKFCATLLEKKDAALAENLARTPNVRKVKLRWVFDFMNGDRGVNYPSPEEILDDGVPFINAGDLVDGFVSKANLKYVSESKYASMGGAKLTVGDILYCLRGSVGKSAVFNGFDYGTLASSLVALRNKAPRILNTEFAFMLLNSRLERTQRDFFMSGTAQPNLAADALARMEFWIPSLSHQLEILEKMSKLSSEIGALIHRVEESSELLIERRGALISEAVTGKIDVRGKD